MSQPPPYSRPYSPNLPPRENPDRRPLPPGWTSQWDSNYNAWFYVNTQENPPRSSWVHPLGPPGSPAPQSYAPPPGPPLPDSRGYSPGYQGQQGPQRYDGYSPGPSPGYGGRSPGYGGPSPGYGGPPPSNYATRPGYGPPRDDRGWFSGTSAPAQQPAVVQQAPPKKSGPGLGTALAVGGAGLLGGALLGDLWENHEEHEREEGFQDAMAMQDGYGGPGPDFGGDFGGGDDFF